MLPLRLKYNTLSLFHIGDENPRKEKYRKAALSEHDGACYDVEAGEAHSQEEGRSGAVV